MTDGWTNKFQVWSSVQSSDMERPPRRCSIWSSNPMPARRTTKVCRQTHCGWKYVLCILIYNCNRAQLTMPCNIQSVSRQIATGSGQQGAQPNVRLQIPRPGHRQGRERNRSEGHFRSGDFLQHHFAAHHFLCRLLAEAQILFPQSGRHSDVCHSGHNDLGVPDWFVNVRGNQNVAVGVEQQVGDAFAFSYL